MSPIRYGFGQARFCVSAPIVPATVHVDGHALQLGREHLAQHLSVVTALLFHSNLGIHLKGHRAPSRGCPLHSGLHTPRLSLQPHTVNQRRGTKTGNSRRRKPTRSTPDRRGHSRDTVDRTLADVLTETSEHAGRGMDAQRRLERPNHPAGELVKEELPDLWEQLAGAVQEALNHVPARINQPCARRREDAANLARDGGEEADQLAALGGGPRQQV